MAQVELALDVNPEETQKRYLSRVTHLRLDKGFSRADASQAHRGKIDNFQKVHNHSTGENLA